MRVLLVDDEELARSRLRSLLQGYDDIEIVGEAQDGEEAIARIDELKPDLVFLDIQMPGCSGTDVVESLRSPRPRIIFCTAFDQYALDAFELAALDYLLKPVTRARLAKAIERARQSSLEANESSLAQAAASGVPRAGRFLAKRAGRYRVVSQSEVLYFAFEEGLTKMHAVDQEYCMDPTLNELEERLDPVGVLSHFPGRNRQSGSCTGGFAVARRVRMGYAEGQNSARGESKTAERFDEQVGRVLAGLSRK